MTKFCGWNCFVVIFEFINITHGIESYIVSLSMKGRFLNQNNNFLLKKFFEIPFYNLYFRNFVFAINESNILEYPYSLVGKTKAIISRTNHYAMCVFISSSRERMGWVDGISVTKEKDNISMSFLVVFALSCVLCNFCVFCVSEISTQVELTCWQLHTATNLSGKRVKWKTFQLKCKCSLISS